MESISIEPEDVGIDVEVDEGMDIDIDIDIPSIVARIVDDERDRLSLRGVDASKIAAVWHVIAAITAPQQQVQIAEWRRLAGRDGLSELQNP